MKRLRQSTINAIAFVLLGIALPSLVAGGLVFRSSMVLAQAAEEAEKRTYLIGEDMDAASDFLMDCARSFTVLNDRASLEAYWREVEVTKRRDLALAEAVAQRIPAEELSALARAKMESDRLVETEGRAMKLVAEALGESGADRREKLAHARELVFGTEYWQGKRAIRDSIEEFRRLSRARAASDTQDSREDADRALVFVAAIGFLAMLGGAAIVIAYYRLTALPVRSYIGSLSTNDPETGYPELVPAGSFELAALAETINMRRAQRLRTERALRDSELKLRTNLQMMPLAALEIDEGNRIQTWNQAAERIFGYSAEEAIGREVIGLIVPDRLKGEIGSIIDRLNRGEVIDRHVNDNVTKDGREITCEWYNTPLYDSRGEWIGWASIVKDITEEKKEADEILYLSRHDPLTGLLNRRSMREKLEEERKRRGRAGGDYSTIMIDIDKFKLFNDEYGHECGDVVLKAVSARIAETIRSTDAASRWGGEEFVVLLPHTDLEGGRGLAEKIRRRIEAERIEYDGGEFGVTVTAGVAACTAGEEPVDECLRRADEALLEGKAQGRNRVVTAACA
jgi:diguanylate cyclase (GGDEF)-like protein/PAS domain S-box-containing protein